MFAGYTYIAIKLATLLTSVIERIVNNTSPVKLRVNLHPFQLGIETAKFNHVNSQFPVS